MKRGVIGLFVVLSVIFVLLLSYQFAAFGRDYSTEQQDVVDHVRYGGVLEGEFSESEVSHLGDVQNVMAWVHGLFWVLLIGIVLVGSYLAREKMLGKAFVWGGFSTVLLVVVIGLWAILGFDSLFTGFHSLFFAAGTWTFPPESGLILLFSPSFFIMVTKDILMLTALFGMVIAVMGVYFFRLVRK
jgi:integral membrane protein (TIGR01906 family)